MRKWKPFQNKRITAEELRLWLEGRDDLGLGVILGAISGNLACRDFDDLDSYHRWSDAHPKLAAELPTVLTPRPGRHVFFRVPDEWLITKDLRKLQPPEDGEFRANSKHIAVLPPTRGKNGKAYIWGVPLRATAAKSSLPLPIIEDPTTAGLFPSGGCYRESRLSSVLSALSALSAVSVPSGALEGSEEVVAKARISSPTPPCGSITDIERILMETLPARVGQRHRMVFQLARRFKAIPELVDAPMESFEGYVRRWHALGRERGVIGTEDANESWIDFLSGWPKVRFPVGQEPMAMMLKQADDEPLPRSADKYENPKLKRLVALCCTLQRAVGTAKPFYLSCHTVSQLLDIAPMCAWRWLFLLSHNKVVEVVEKGTTRRATRYRYLGADR